MTLKKMYIIFSDKAQCGIGAGASGSIKWLLNLNLNAAM